jgi:NitT/TauT family transport system permease protein
MSSRRNGLTATIAAALLLLAVALPLSNDAGPLAASPAQLALTIAAATLFAVCGWLTTPVTIAFGLVGVVLGCGQTLALLERETIAGQAGAGYWALVVGTWIAAALCVTRLSALKPASPTAQRGLNLLVPLVFGAFVLYLWEVTVRGFGIPGVLIPAPSAIAIRLFGSLPTLGEDFVQTFVRGVLTGYALGCCAGLIVAILAHRFAFLGRGLVPLSNFASALPIVGIAPIMVMWFGFDWPSKAAVVTIITFFPMLVNTLAGLAAAGAIERDLMRSYGSTYRQTLWKLSLPAAMPFIFNALKINSTLALIGAIVAEFFGTPTRGMGFRISIEVARMSLDMVWAEITLAALAGMTFYGAVALAERATTFWHPSYRS